MCVHLWRHLCAFVTYLWIEDNQILVHCTRSRFKTSNADFLRTFEIFFWDSVRFLVPTFLLSILLLGQAHHEIWVVHPCSSVLLSRTTTFWPCVIYPTFGHAAWSARTRPTCGPPTWRSHYIIILYKNGIKKSKNKMLNKNVQLKWKRLNVITYWNWFQQPNDKNSSVFLLWINLYCNK